MALLAGGMVLRRIERVERGHAELLFPLIDRVLEEATPGYAGLGRVVCCTGPGSFVGTRIGVAAARGLALGIGCPALGVSRFEALAAEARGEGRLAVGVVLASRGGAAFFQPFDAAGRPLREPRIVPAEAPDPALLDGLDLLAGEGAPDWDALPRRLPEGLPDPVVIARLGAVRDVAEAPAPLYLRPPAADLPREAPPRLLD